MSLTVINEGPETPESYREGFARLWQGIRVAVAVEQKFDTETLGRSYTALGTRPHDGVAAWACRTLSARWWDLRSGRSTSRSSPGWAG